MRSYWCGHLHEHTQTHTQECVQSQTGTHTLSEWCMAFTFRQPGERDRHFSPSANSCLRQNNKRLDDIVSRPLWSQNGNGTRNHLSKASSHSLSLSCASTEALADLKDRLTSIESCWSVLKRQSITTYRARWSNETAENKLGGSFGRDEHPQSGPGRKENTHSIKPAWCEITV